MWGTEPVPFILKCVTGSVCAEVVGTLTCPGVFLPVDMGLVYSEPTCQLAYDGDVHQLFRLLSHDPDNLNVQDARTGDTPIIAACRHGNLRVVKYLLENRADVHLTNKKQRTCLHYVSKRTFSLLDYLMISLLMPILLLGYFLMLQKQRQHMTLMNTVLSSKVNVNAVDYKGNTALHYICERKTHRLVPLLLNRNADINVKNNDGETPLDIATRLKFNKIIHMLKKTK
uniref:Ankyrin repeat domain 22 n=2 Tax=Seriola dumerili TaxID=41447 RepID=A0A3B4UNG6_SERDU